ncbi:hypothetical protein ABEO74_23255, partial [Brevibacillus borstelensis]|uniref:hypothetical protein n=1 Tax=Brevibacillus borstelensis TaxID=45462 RepID=UPI003D1EB5DD
LLLKWKFKNAFFLQATSEPKILFAQGFSACFIFLEKPLYCSEISGPALLAKAFALLSLFLF